MEKKEQFERCLGGRIYEAKWQLACEESFSFVN